MVFSDRICDRLEKHRLTRTRRSDDECTLAFADRRDQIYNAGWQIVRRAGLHLELLVRVKRRQVIKENFLSSLAWILKVDSLDLDQSEVTFTFFRRPDLARHGVAGAKVKLSYLGRRDVNVVRTWKVVVLRCTQKAESIGQRLQDAFTKDQPALLSLRGKNFKDEFLLAKSRGPLDAHLLCDVR